VLIFLEILEKAILEKAMWEGQQWMMVAQEGLEKDFFICFMQPFPSKREFLASRILSDSLPVLSSTSVCFSSTSTCPLLACFCSTCDYYLR
jgi:hypothetical protein